MELLKEFKAELRKLANYENKAVAVYKKLALIAMEMAEVEAVSKKMLQNTITETLQKRGLSDSSIKKIRGSIMAFFEGAKKFPHKIEIIKIRLSNISSRAEFEGLAKSFKNHGETETPQKEGKNNPKNRGGKNEIVTGEETIDKGRYFAIISRVIKIDEDTFYKLDDDAILTLFDEVEKIAKILGGIKG